MKPGESKTWTQDGNILELSRLADGWDMSIKSPIPNDPRSWYHVTVQLDSIARELAAELLDAETAPLALRHEGPTGDFQVNADVSGGHTWIMPAGDGVILSVAEYEALKQMLEWWRGFTTRVVERPS